MVHTKKNRITPGRFIALGFISIMLLGALLLMLPISHKEGVEVSFLDALFTSTSAVCVTGLVVLDTGAAFSVFGQTVIAVLIQIGGLGVTTFGLGLILVMRKKTGMREMNLAKESFNQSTVKGAMSLIRTVFFATVAFEAIGALMFMPVFIRDYGALRGVGYSVFHSVASFNNAGFDVFGTGNSMYAYIDHAYVNIVTALLVVFGGLGFFVMMDICTKKKPRKYTLHTKIVLFMTALLILVGTLLLKLTEGDGISWLSSFFTSVSTRTAGFATRPMAQFSNAGIIVISILMVIGASPGSTGGGIKTTTAFVLVRHLFAYCTNSETEAFRRKIPEGAIRKALAILMLAVCVVLTATCVICALEPELSMRDVVFEVCSGFGTAGLSTGITAGLCGASKAVLILSMFLGRLGPLSIATLWISNTDTGISRAEETVPVG